MPYHLQSPTSSSFQEASQRNFVASFVASFLEAERTPHSIVYQSSFQEAPHRSPIDRNAYLAGQQPLHQAAFLCP